MRPLTTLLMLSVVTLAGVVYMELQQGLFAPKLAMSVTVPASQVTPQRDEETLTKRRDVGALVDIVERPLFRPERRPPEVVVAPVAQVDMGPKPADLARYALVGTVIIRDTRPERNIETALLREAGASALVELRRGDELNGWRVDSMLSETITFKAGEQVVVLELDQKK